VRIGDAQVIVETRGRATLQPGDKVTFTVNPANVHLFDQASGARLPA
jgi:ABC-type sugar transport system ATPase subunit